MRDDMEIEEKAPRDAKGRWLKGVCGNPKGRPRNGQRLSEADPFFFGQELLPVTRGGKRVLRTRREINNLRMWERAMAGSVQAQIHLDRTWHRNDKLRAEAQALLSDLEETWILGGRAAEMPIGVELQIMGLRSFLRVDGEFWASLPKKRLRRRPS